METKEIILQISDENPEALFADGFEEALLGSASQFNKTLALYDYYKCIEILQKDMSYEDAVEYFEFNISNAYVGENTPMFARILRK